jgi:membrane protease YdiL (CAAX protease family)
VESGHSLSLLPDRPLLSSEPVDFLTHLADCTIFTTISLLWAKWSKLDIGLSPPAFRRAEPWVLLYILWGTAEWAIAIFLPFDEYSDWWTWMGELSPLESLIVLVLFAPVAEELFFRGAMFAALLRRFGIWAATIVPSLLWGLLHTQYEWWTVASLTGSGVLLAMVRWKSGSLYLPIGLHAGWNLLVTLNNLGWFGPVA